MKSQYVYKLIAIIGLFIFGFIYFFDWYKYYDYEIESCTSEDLIINLQLIGTYTELLPHQKGNPYFLRIEIKNIINDIYLSEKLEFISPSKNTSLSIEAIVKSDSSKGRKGSSIFIVDPISLPYDDYTLKGFLTSKNSTTEKFECKIKRKFHQEFRLTFWDNILSV